MDDEFARQFARPGQRRPVVPRRAVLPHPLVAFSLNLMPTAPDDGSSHPAAVREVRVGRVDDGIHARLGQVAVIEQDDLAGREGELGDEGCHCEKDCTTRVEA
jgi:hypothetical protein